MDELQDDDPRQIGKYTLLARLGAGGMGQVFLGRSLAGRQVAVKVVHPELARDQSFRRRFAREIEAARRVSGAFTAPVIDADPDARMPWLVTGYVNGPSLASAVEEHGPLPVSSVLTLAAGLAEGLGAVHAAGVIHRDLKPSNVLLAQDGPRLIDFGISHAADFSHVTLVGSVVGTPGFMSPEQALGDQVGPSGDIFSLGAVLAFAATGEGPYGAGSPAARQMRMLALAPRLDNVPGELRPLIERCMAREPADRPTADQFLTELVTTHPAAANQTDWLPAGILGTTASLPAQLATPPVATPPVATPPVRVDAVDAPSAPELASPAPRPGWGPTLTSTPSGHAAAAAAPRQASADVLRQQPGPEPAHVPADPSPPQSPPGKPVGPPGPPSRWAVSPGAAGRPSRRRRRWPAVVAAVVVAAGLAATSPLWASSSGNGQRGTGPTTGSSSPGSSSSASGTPVLRPTGLATSAMAATSVELVWSGPATGPVPDQYEVLQDGTEAGSVQGTTTDYQDVGLLPGTSYKFSVVAVRGGRKSQPSSTLTVTTPTPALSDAQLNWTGTVDEKVTTSTGYAYFKVGRTLHDTWTFTPDCTSGPCDVELSGAVNGWPFTAKLTRQGSTATYSGSTAINQLWSCSSSSNYTNSTLHIQVTGQRAGVPLGGWTITSFTGTTTWDVAYNPSQGCVASVYKMQLNST